MLRVIHDKYGEGKIIMSVKCRGNLSTHLLTIKFKNINYLISLYDDEIRFIT